MKTISTLNKPAGAFAVSPTASDATAHQSTWHSPVPYLFGGLAAMLALIAFALVILACSYRKHWGRRLNRQGGTGNRDLESGDGEKEGESGKVGSAKVYEEKILVIMAGDEKPTHLATPVCANCSSFSDGIRNDSEKGDENSEVGEKSEKEMDSHVQAASATPRENESTQQSLELRNH